jgi:hypothetical protein
MNMNDTQKRIEENVMYPYSMIVKEINDLLDSTASVLPACLFHKYCQKWIGLAKYVSFFFKNDPDALRFFESLHDFTYNQRRDLLMVKMKITNMRMVDCKISACQNFCEQCVLRSFSNQQCTKFFQDIAK